jgi:transposase-like protein
MKWPAWFTRKQPDRAAVTSPMEFPDPTKCPDCGQEMDFVEKNTMSGRDLRTYRCDHCRKEHDVDLGVAMWKRMSNANKSD